MIKWPKVFWFVLKIQFMKKIDLLSVPTDRKFYLLGVPTDWKFDLLSVPTDRIFVSWAPQQMENRPVERPNGSKIDQLSVLTDRRSPLLEFDWFGHLPLKIIPNGPIKIWFVEIFKFARLGFPTDRIIDPLGRRLENTSIRKHGYWKTRWPGALAPR